MPVNKIQTNEYGVNVLVEVEGGNSTHSHYSDVRVKDVKVVSKEQLLTIFNELPEEYKVEAAKKYLKSQKGYAVSHVQSKKVKIGDIVTYTI